MASIFSKIINGEIPGRFVWRDDKCVAFLDAFPLTHGHVLVVPREEVDHWIDADEALMDHLWRVARTIGQAQMQAFECQRIGVMVAGYEIPHLHIHTFPTTQLADFDLGNKMSDPDQDVLDSNADLLRAALREAGHGAAVDRTD